VLARIARTSYRHRRRVLLAWIVALVVTVMGGSAIAGHYATGAKSNESLLSKEFPARNGNDAAVVFADVSRDRPAVDGYLSELAHVPGVLSVDPLDVAADGHIARAPFVLANGVDDKPGDVARHAKEMAAPLEQQGVDVEFSGGWFGEGGMPSTELIGVLAAIVILLVAFGSVIAMGVPIVTALFGVAIATAGVGVVANVFSTPDFTAQVASMIGIGVGIDYALFIVTRYRDALDRGTEREDAVVEAISTAGRAVVFAGCTVMVSILGMFLMGIEFLDGLAVGVSLAVAIAVVAAVTLLPALLGFIGKGIDRLRVRRHRRLDHVGAWQRWARFVQRRPWPVAVAGLAFLVAAAVPVFGLRLGFADEGNAPQGDTTRAAYDLVAQGFGPGANGPIVVLADTSRTGGPEAFGHLLNDVRALPGVASVGPPIESPSKRATLATVIPTTGPQARATEQLVHRLRDDVVTRYELDDMHVDIAGQTAGGIDFADQVSSRLPIFIGAVLGASFLLLLVVFRSVLVPLKAVLMNLLSIGAAYGVMVAVFQWGWFGDALGITGGPIEPWAPMMLFAIVFGLSMDYEVFLLSSVRERYDATGDNAGAVAGGLAATARVITAAAAIMVFVFGSFVLSDVRALKLIGLGLAVAVAVDATIVRVVLVPATMELLGKANWWLPRGLARILPKVDVDGTPLPPPVVTPERERTLVG
jgi:RND superfamily putative drug exporter